MIHNQPSSPGTLRSRTQARARLLSLLRQHQTLPAEQIEEIEHRSRWLNEPLEELLLREELLDEATLAKLLSASTGFPVVSMTQLRIPREVLEKMPINAVAKYAVIPMSCDEHVMTLATHHIPSLDDEDQLRMLLGYSLDWALCLRRELKECIKHYYGVGIDTFLKIKSFSEKKRDSEITIKSEDQQDVPDFVADIIRDAIEINATDIHVEPDENALTMRYRVDGVLYPIPLPRGVEKFQRAITSSIKVMAQMNIAEKRLPQDGRFTHEIDGEPFDLRVSILPTRYGESVNLRILNRKSTFLHLNELHLATKQRQTLMDLLNLTFGMILFTGPTGSGKTTSLYAALDHLNNRERKIITIEDPVEYQIENITQIQVEPNIGLTFASGLRSLLRHDPDVMLIGEIRDRETADIATSAALTGHLVFSTLHTNDSASAAVRMMDMGIEPYLVASTINGIVAQRLIRCTCAHCRKETLAEPSVIEEVRRNFPERSGFAFYQGQGCPYCRFTGYEGRRAIFEVLIVNDELRSMLIERASSTALMNKAVARGLTSLRQSAWNLVLEGNTSIQEVLRVTQKPKTDNR